jgi:hypothetical protein
VGARVLGHARRAAQVRRLAILRELWPTGRPLRLIAERLGVTESTVSALARTAGLPPRVTGRPRAAG